ncbi:MAG: hypothetical protein ACLTSK_01865 [Christensenellales bacterium]
MESYVTAQSDALIRDIIPRNSTGRAGFSRLATGGNDRLVRRATQNLVPEVKIASLTVR